MSPQKDLVVLPLLEDDIHESSSVESSNDNDHTLGAVEKAAATATTLLTYPLFDAAGAQKVLSSEQIARFEQDGFLVAETFFTQTEIDAIDTMAKEVEACPDKKGGIWKYYNMQPSPPDAGNEKSEEIKEDESKEKGNDGKFLDRVENFADKNEGFANLFLKDSSKIVTAVSELFGEKAMLWKEKMNFKKPGSNGFAPHQDAQAGWLLNGQTYHINVGVMVDDTTIENGCLQFVRGHHKQGMIGPVFDNIPPENLRGLEWEHLPAKRTTVVFFDSFAPHQSSPNATSKDRRVALSTYAKASEYHLDTREMYFDRKIKTFPPNIYKEDYHETYRGYKI